MSQKSPHFALIAMSNCAPFKLAIQPVFVALHKMHARLSKNILSTCRLLLLLFHSIPLYLQRLMIYLQPVLSLSLPFTKMCLCASLLSLFSPLCMFLSHLSTYCSSLSLSQGSFLFEAVSKFFLSLFSFQYHCA